MVELARVSLPNRDWLCRNCGEPYRKDRPPKQHACVACGQETVWELSDDALAEIIDNLENLSEGDQLTVVSDGPAPLRGIVSNVDEGLIRFGTPGDRRDVHYDPDPDDEDGLSMPRLTDVAEKAVFGNNVYYVTVTPEDELEEETTITRSFKTPIDDMVQDGAATCGIDPRTAELKDARVVDGKLSLRVEGEPK